MHVGAFLSAGALATLESPVVALLGNAPPRVWRPLTVPKADLSIGMFIPGRIARHCGNEGLHIAFEWGPHTPP
jgi:hypothetical protein